MGAATPTLSQIHAWDTEHLQAAANHWESRAQTWQDAYDAVYREVPSPGGTPWEGRAADMAITHVGNDRLRVIGAADMLYDASAVARSGADELSFAKQQALDSINAAQAQGFNIGEDLSVTDRLNPPSALLRANRQAQAQAHAATIKTGAAGLAATDNEVAAKITTAAAGLRGVQFASNMEPASPDDVTVGDNANRQGSIQMVDNTTHSPPPLDPPPPPAPPSPAPVTGDPIKLPTQTSPPPVQVIDASPPDGAPSGGPPSGVGFPKCGADVVVGRLLEVLAGGTLAGVSVPGEAVTAGAATAGILGGASLVYNGVDGLKNCK